MNSWIYFWDRYNTYSSPFMYPESLFGIVTALNGNLAKSKTDGIKSDTKAHRCRIHHT